MNSGSSTDSPSASSDFRLPGQPEPTPGKGSPDALPLVRGHQYKSKGAGAALPTKKLGPILPRLVDSSRESTRSKVSRSDSDSGWRRHSSITDEDHLPFMLKRGSHKTEEQLPILIEISELDEGSAPSTTRAPAPSDEEGVRSRRAENPADVGASKDVQRDFLNRGDTHAAGREAIRRRKASWDGFLGDVLASYKSDLKNVRKLIKKTRHELNDVKETIHDLRNKGKRDSEEYSKAVDTCIEVKERLVDLYKKREELEKTVDQRRELRPGPKD